MTTQQIERFRRLLQMERDAVVSEIKAHRGIGSAGGDEVEGAIVESDENFLQKIELALARIDEGTYGTCLACKADIPIARLDAKPAVSLCTKCQEAKERTQLP